MTPGALSLLYAPPFSIVARFFITASILGLGGSILSLCMLLSGEFSLQALVHIFTLGFAAMTMVGALFQMLPVVAGAVIENPLPKAAYTHITLLSGTLLLVAGFLYGNKLLLSSGLILVALSVLFIAPLMLYKLFKLKSYTPTSMGMRYALGSFIAGTLVGMALVTSLLGKLEINYLRFAEAHFSFMLFGWVGILIASVAFQVIEMFFVTPPYPKRYANAFHPVVVALLLLYIVLEWWLFKALLSLLFISFAFFIVVRLRERRRKIPDPLISLWYTGMLFLTASMLLYPFVDFGSKGFLLFLLLYGVFVHSIILAMMYRIIPFLVWLHLSNMGVPDAPTMHEVIRPKKVWIQFYMHWVSVLLLLTSFFSGFEVLWFICAVSYAVSFGWLFLNLSSGTALFFKKAGQRDVFPQR
ncbi:hypothetical protein [Hydrogenivirga sp. 128-5-R1-1]|uniref:hypothetical protein n=1 Tax=Hydrogenivirga sp. 128-5-R1-1 TaxID=392423 RepID=UPI00015F1603|nr:hypothetical protein [Hydrogenivirga sp. 128-5-R1-1]EDP74735.1 hypothetical protein HG1285_08594 [Hydrogenivirga sp. 128-5-R1-1]